MKAVLWVCVVAAAACSDSKIPSSSGVDSNKKLTQLTPLERTQLCDYAVEVVGEMRSESCNGTTVTLMVKGTCDQETTAIRGDCEVTVGQAESCFKALDADLCNAITACAALTLCAPDMVQLRR
jgi:hypothetical protein